jgi:hypothetical protein
VVFSTYVSLFRNKYQILIKLTLSMHVRNYVQLIKAFLCLMVACFPDGWLVHGLCGVDTSTRRLDHKNSKLSHYFRKNGGLLRTEEYVEDRIGEAQVENAKENK